MNSRQNSLVFSEMSALFCSFFANPNGFLIFTESHVLQYDESDENTHHLSCSVYTVNVANPHSDSDWIFRILHFWNGFDMRAERRVFSLFSKSKTFQLCCFKRACNTSFLRVLLAIVKPRRSRTIPSRCPLLVEISIPQSVLMRKRENT